MIRLEQPSRTPQGRLVVAPDRQPSPYYAGEIQVAEGTDTAVTPKTDFEVISAQLVQEGTNTVWTLLDGFGHGPSWAAQTFKRAVEKYDSLLRRLAD